MRRLTILILLAAIVCLAAPRIIPSIISIKLKAEIAARLNARLKLGRVTYLWPYGIRIEHAQLTSLDSGTGGTSLIDVGQIEITLAKLPVSEGPLLIQKLDIHEPFVHLVRTASGLAEANLSKNTASPTTPDTSRKKLSDLFELRRLTVTGGRVEYDDRSQSHPIAPVVWDNLQADLQTTPTSRSKYQFQFTAKNAPVALIEAAGDMDIDTLLLNISRLSIAVQTDVDKPAEQLPSQIQAICRKFAVKGEVNVTASARIPLHNANHAVYAAELSLRQGSCKLPNWDAPLSPVELTLSCGNSTADAAALPTTLPDRAPDIQLHLSNLKVASGNQTLRFSGDGHISPLDNTWSVEHIIGLADLGDGPGLWRDAGVTSHLPFTIGGAGEFASGDYLLRFAINDASALFVPKNLPLNQLAANATLTPSGLKITRLTGTLCGGDLALHSNLAWTHSATPSAYSGQLAITNLDMRQVANVLLPDEKSRQMASGQGELHLQFHGPFPPDASPVDGFTARGDFDIRHGHFADIPVLKEALAKVKEANAATVGEAAAIFNISHRQIYFDQAAANAPAVGVQGHGTLGFNGSVNMSFIATPLADWREKLASTDVPILNTVGALIAGKAQAAVNVAESAVLYQYRVTGTVSDPKTEQIPAPVLTDAIRPLFQKMSHQNPDDAMSVELRRQQQQESPKTENQNSN
jgi:hypothetical protein